MIRCILPWPPSALRPNASSPGAWRKKQTAAALYKSLCLYELNDQDIGKVNATKLHLTLCFRPPDDRRRDLDNMLAQVKQGIDAIAETVGVDDYHFGLTLVRGSKVKGGRVEVVIHEE